MPPMATAILIAHGNLGDALHDRAFEIALKQPTAAWIGAAASDSIAAFERTAALLPRRYGADVGHARAMPMPGQPLDLGATRSLIDNAQLVYIAGGDVSLLAERLRALELDARIRRRAQAGAVVVGVSAGAIGLTRHW